MYPGGSSHVTIDLPPVSSAAEGSGCDYTARDKVVETDPAVVMCEDAHVDPYADVVSSEESCVVVVDGDKASCRSEIDA